MKKMEARHPGHPEIDAILDEAKQSLSAGDCANAIKKYKLCINYLGELPSNTDNYFLLFSCYEEMGRAYFYSIFFQEEDNASIVKDNIFSALQYMEGILEIIQKENSPDQDNNNNNSNEQSDQVLYRLAKNQKKVGDMHEDFDMRNKTQEMYLAAIDNIASLKLKNKEHFTFLSNIYSSLARIYRQHSYQHAFYTIFSEILTEDATLNSHYSDLDILLLELQDHPLTVKNNFIHALTVILNSVEADDFPDLCFKKILKENEVHHKTLRNLIKNERENQPKLTTIHNEASKEGLKKLSILNFNSKKAINRSKSEETLTPGRRYS